MNEAELTALRNWREICAAIRRRSGSDTVFGVIQSIVELLSVDGDDLQFGVTDSFAEDWVRENYMEFLTQSVEEVFGRKMNFHFRTGHIPKPVELSENKSVAAADKAVPVPSEVSSEKAPPKNIPVDSRIMPEQARTADGCLKENTFANFVVGEENRYAFTAATMAAQVPGRWNPLYIYGGSGMGKTHLIQAVANEVAANNPQARIRYVTCEEFLNEYVNSLRTRTDFKFREHFRNADLLLVDDVHFLSGKTQLQEEFFNTFNALYNAGHQIVLTSDKQPSEIPGLEKRLVSRFQSGQTMQITASTFETRLAILRQVQDLTNLHFSDDVLRYLALHITSNMRPLKSALVRLSVFATSGVEITVDAIDELLPDLMDKEAEAKSARLSLDAIQKTVADHYGLQVRDLTGSKRPKNIADARMVAMYLCRKLTNASQQDIGQAFGGRTHATVIHAVKQIEELCRTDENAKHEISSLQRKLQYD